jgi:phosphoglycerate dehydrogenase-like enzyme
MRDAPKIIVHCENPAPLAQRLQQQVPGAEIGQCGSYGGLAELVARFAPDIVYSVRFAGTPGFPRAALTGPTGPRWVSVGGSGTDHLGQWNPDRTIVTNAAGVGADMMAEYAFGVFLHFTLDIPGLTRDKAARVWNPRKVAPLAGKTLLIVGLGQTGRAVGERARAFGMTVIGIRARPRPTAGIAEVHGPDALTRLLPRADFIAVCTPLLPATRGLIGPAAIAAMKPDAILADVSRGGVVDQAALFDALKIRRIAGAGLDVFETEPLPPESPLWALENLIISPHCSSVYEGWEDSSFDMFLSNLARWMRGETLRNTVDPTRGY